MKHLGRRRARTALDQWLGLVVGSCPDLFDKKRNRNETPRHDITEGEFAGLALPPRRNPVACEVAACPRCALPRATVARNPESAEKPRHDTDNRVRPLPFRFSLFHAREFRSRCKLLLLL